WHRRTRLHVVVPAHPPLTALRTPEPGEPKKADAVLRISLARFNSLFSRRNRLSSSSSALVGPSSRWASRRACLSHVRNVCGETPSFSPTAVAAPHPPVS